MGHLQGQWGTGSSTSSETGTRARRIWSHPVPPHPWNDLDPTPLHHRTRESPSAFITPPPIKISPFSLPKSHLRPPQHPGVPPRLWDLPSPAPRGPVGAPSATLGPQLHLSERDGDVEAFPGEPVDALWGNWGVRIPFDFQRPPQNHHRFPHTPPAPSKPP